MPKKRRSPFGCNTPGVESGSKRRVDTQKKYRKSMKRRKKGLEEKGENTERHFKNIQKT